MTDSTSKSAMPTPAASTSFLSPPSFSSPSSASSIETPAIETTTKSATDAGIKANRNKATGSQPMTATHVPVGVDRHRPTTFLTPDAKRSKKVDPGSMTVAAAVPVPAKAHTMVVSYPTKVAIPSKRTITALYKAALDDSANDPLTPSTSMMQPLNDQKYLKLAGVLSFEQVLLPALALEEEQAVKRLQAKIQRDAPEYKVVVENCRRLIRRSVAKAMVAVQGARQERIQQQQDRRREEAMAMQAAKRDRQKALQEEQEMRAQEDERQKQDRLAQRKVQLARQYPRNQDFWKEVVFLTSSMAQLEKEERMWMQTERDLQMLEQSNIYSEGGKENQTGPSSNVQRIDPPKDHLHVQTEQKMRDIVLASSRIQKGLVQVLQLLEDSESARKELYNKYYQDHYFHGYTAVDNPKGMIRFLSQSQDDYN